MKRLSILFVFCALFLAACATKTNLARQQEPLRSYPVFMMEGQQNAVFKAEALAGNYKAKFLLMLTSSEQEKIQIKILGDYAAVLVRATFKDGVFSYQYLPEGFFSKTALAVFEDTIKNLLQEPKDFKKYKVKKDNTLISFKSGKFLNTYYFRQGDKSPYQMKQSKGFINKDFYFDDYRYFNGKSVPYSILVSEAKGRAAIELTLLSLK